MGSPLSHRALVSYVEGRRQLTSRWRFPAPQYRGGLSTHDWHCLYLSIDSRKLLSRRDPWWTAEFTLCLEELRLAGVVHVPCPAPRCSSVSVLIVGKPWWGIGRGRCVSGGRS